MTPYDTRRALGEKLERPRVSRRQCERRGWTTRLVAPAPFQRTRTMEEHIARQDQARAREHARVAALEGLRYA